MADFDEGMEEAVFEETIGGIDVGKSLDERGDGGGVGESAEAFGGEADQVGIGGGGGDVGQVLSKGVEEEAGGVGVSGGGGLAELGEGRGRAQGRGLDEAGVGGGTFIGGESGGVGTSDAIDAAEDIAFGELGTGTTQFVPTAGIDHEEGAVGVFEDIGGAEIGVIGGQEILVQGGVGSAVEGEGVEGDFAEIEEGGEEGVAVLGAEGGGGVAMEGAGGGGTEVGEDGEEVAGAADHGFFEGIVGFAEDASVDGMGEAVASAGLAEVDEGTDEDGFAFGGEGEFDGIIHAAGEDAFQAGAVGFGAEDVGGAIADGATAAIDEVETGEGALGPIEEAVGAEVGAMDIIGAAGEHFTAVPFLASIGFTVAIGVGEFPDGRWTGDIDGAVMPEASLGEHDVVGEDGGAVEAAIAVGIFQAEDAVVWVVELFRGGAIGAGGIGDVEATLGIEAAGDGTWDEVGAGGQFDDQGSGEGEGVRAEGLGVGRGGFGGGGAGGEAGEEEEGEAGEGDRFHAVGEVTGNA